MNKKSSNIWVLLSALGLKGFSKKETTFTIKIRKTFLFKKLLELTIGDSVSNSPVTNINMSNKLVSQIAVDWFIFFIYFFKKFSNETLMVFVAVSTAIWYSSQKDK